jgi:pyridoxal phosphate enzyme (YggS family)
VSTVAANLKQVIGRMERAALRSGRQLSDVKLVVVTKSVSVELIKEVIEAGVTDIGENKAQELVEKYEQLDGSIEWHFIGHLQRNKVKNLISRVDLIQSLDSLRLAEEIEKQAAKTGQTQDVLVEINIGGEESKYGVLIDEAVKFFTDVSRRFKRVKVIGLMTIAPLVENAEEIRPLFARMKSLFDELKAIELPRAEMRILSMGMSNDFEVAIEEGANMVRIGTAIFQGSKFASSPVDGSQ